MTPIEAMLRDYLADVGSKGFALGGDVNCCTLMADWLMRRGLPDVMADRRGAYAADSEYRGLLMAEGGLVAACHRRFSDAGLTVTHQASAGDVAVVMLPFARRHGAVLRRPAGAIAVSQGAFAMIVRRHVLISTRMPVAKMWAVNHG